MTFQRSILTVGTVALLGLAQLGLAAGARADEPTYAIARERQRPGDQHRARGTT